MDNRIIAALEACKALTPDQLTFVADVIQFLAKCENDESVFQNVMELLPDMEAVKQFMLKFED